MITVYTFSWCKYGILKVITENSSQIVTFFSFPGLGGLLTSSLDGKLIPEHLLRLCLEHGSKLVSSQKSSANYNFYKVLKTFLPASK